MGFYNTVGSKITDLFKKEIVDNLPILYGNESFCSDLDFFIKIANAFEMRNCFNKGIVTDMAISAGHLKFEFRGIPVAVFNISSVLANPAVKLPLSAQGILGNKENEVSNWETEYKGKQYAIIILEFGNADTINETEHLFARSAHSTIDLRYVIKHNNF